jgi:predicted dehydrogenase
LKTAAAGAAIISIPAKTYARAQGANDRINIGVIGCGSRGIDAHMVSINKFAKEQNVQFVAVADPWRVRQDMAAAKIKEWQGTDAKKISSYRDLLALKDVDAVTIASCDHQHTTHLMAAVKAGKDIYVEKPLSKDLDSLKACYDAIKASDLVVQCGTQLRSMPSMTGVRELYKTGVLGKVARIEQCRNGSRPYWYGYLKDAKQEDIDWDEFLMDAPKKPFDPNLYTGWYGYRDYSDGPVPGFGSHYIDLINYITGSKFPKNAVCLGGVYTWKDKYNFTCPDHVQAMWEYPEGFMVHYSTNFGNGSGSTFKILGDRGVMDLLDWEKPMLSGDGVMKEKGPAAEKKTIEPVDHPDHFLDWLQCMRTRNTPNASIDAGYQHAVACLMAVKAYDTGKRQIYDVEKREIREG